MPVFQLFIHNRKPKQSSSTYPELTSFSVIGGAPEPIRTGPFVTQMKQTLRDKKNKNLPLPDTSLACRVNKAALMQHTERLHQGFMMEICAVCTHQKQSSLVSWVHRAPPLVFSGTSFYKHTEPHVNTQKNTRTNGARTHSRQWLLPGTPGFPPAPSS